MGTSEYTGYALQREMMAWRGHKGDPGMEANGIRRVSLLACRVIVHLIKNVTPVEVMETSPLVR